MDTPYRLRVTLTDGREWTETWDHIPPMPEGAIFTAMARHYLEGEGTCDCVKWRGMGAHAVCGHDLTLATLTGVRPDGTDLRLWPRAH